LQGSKTEGPKTESAAVEAELRAYFARKRSISVWSLVLVTVAAIPIAGWSPIGGVALAFGGVCGVVNALLTMRGNERLVDNRSVVIFALSSVLRICVFGIVPVEFAAHGPWWTMALYFCGFFLPLALYAISVARAL
jgi:hypothetical protein